MSMDILRCKRAPGRSDARDAAIDPSRHLLYVVNRAASGGTSYVQTIPLR